MFIIRPKSPYAKVQGPFETREAAEQYAKDQFIRLDNKTRIEPMEFSTFDYELERSRKPGARNSAKAAPR